MKSKYNNNKILTITPPYKKPKGGIGQVVNSYSKIFDPFYTVITTSYESNRLKKLFILLNSLIHFFYYMTFKDIKIVHIHTASENSFKRKSLFINLSKLFRKKVLLHIHGASFKEFTSKNKKFIGTNLKKCDKIIALSDSWKQFFTDIYDLKNVTVLPNIVENPIKKEYVSEDKLKILYLGIIGDRKGIFDLLSILKENKDFYKTKIIINIGGNGEIERLNEYITDNQLEELVNYEGWVSGNKKIELLNSTDIYILPSYNEGLPISILEAMSYGKPIISTNVGGIPEIVDNQNGIIIEPGDKKALKAAINYFLNNRDEINKKGLESLKKVQKHLPDNVKRQLIRIYEDLLF